MGQNLLKQGICMVRSKSAFSWKHGNVPVCKIHSRVKLEILRSYLASYFPTVASNPKIDTVKIHLVDAFSGGGIYRDSQNGELVAGSPIAMLEAVHDAEAKIGKPKKKPFSINANYHFADRCSAATSRLIEVIGDFGFGELMKKSKVTVDQLPFDKFLPLLLEKIPANPKTKAIFFLDQTGWNTATLKHCNTILQHLPKAEIIWNISVESMATYANENTDFRSAVSKFGVDLGDAFTSLPTYSHYSNWRKALVSHLLFQIRGYCCARYVSPFMVQHDGWGFWLLHLSNHHEANDVMKSTHWGHQNSSLHEGFPGLNMLKFDQANFNQATMWRFDEEAEAATQEALVDELMPKIYELGETPTIRELIESIANETPANRKRIYSALTVLHHDDEFSLRGPKGQKRISKPQSLDDRLILPRRRQFRLVYE